MLSVIKTAIITIMISFISGVLLDSYKNFAPRILCTLTKPVPLKHNNKKIKAYTLIIRNISNKTIHNLTVNIQEHYDFFSVHEPRITGGLKFEDSHEDNNYNVAIPFLSKNDEFSVKVFVENRQGVDNKPIVALRSPEDFKRVDSTGHNGLLAVLCGIPKDIGDLFSKKNYNARNTELDNRERNNNLYHRNSGKRSTNYNLQNDSLKHKSSGKSKQGLFSKKVFISGVCLFLLIYLGILGVEYYNKAVGSMENPLSNANVQQNYNDISTKNKTESTNSTGSTKTESKKAFSNKSQNTDKDDTSSIKSSENAKDNGNAGTLKDDSRSKTVKNVDDSEKSKSTSSENKDDTSNSKSKDGNTNNAASDKQKSSSDKQISDSSKNSTEKQSSDENSKSSGSNTSCSETSKEQNPVQNPSKPNGGEN